MICTAFQCKTDACIRDPIRGRVLAKSKACAPLSSQGQAATCLPRARAIAASPASLKGSLARSRQQTAQPAQRPRRARPHANSARKVVVSTPFSRHCRFALNQSNAFRALAQRMRARRAAWFSRNQWRAVDLHAPLSDMHTYAASSTILQGYNSLLLAVAPPVVRSYSWIGTGYLNPNAFLQIGNGLRTTTFAYDNNGNVTQKTTAA